MITAIQRYVANKISNDPLLASTAFRRYWLSSVFNSFGAQIGSLAVPLCAALLLNATPGQMGLLLTCQALPFTLFSLPAGVWLDRRRKLPVLVTCQVIQGLLVAGMPFAWWLDILSMPWLYATVLAFQTCNVLGGGAEQIFVTLLVGRERLLDAQAKFTMSDSVSRLFAPGLAGLLIQWLTAPYALLFNAATFIFSVWNLKRASVTEPEPVPSGKHPLRDIHDGFIFVWSNPLLRTMAWVTGIWFILSYGYSSLQVLLATRELGMSPGMLGAAQTLGGIGVFVSSRLMQPLNTKLGPGKTILAGMCGTILGWVLMPAIPASLFGLQWASTVAYAALVFVYDCSVMLFIIPYMALRAKVTPDEYMGRMIATMRFLTVATAPLGAMAAGYLADRHGVRAGMACVGACGVLLAAAMIASPHIRSVRPD